MAIRIARTIRGLKVECCMTLITDEIGFSGHPWPQYREEVERFVAILQAEGVRSYLEIGCRYGDTVHFIGSRLPQGSKVVAVDLPGAVRGKHACSGDYLRRAVDALRELGQDGHVILGNSHDLEVLGQVRQLGPFDAVFIDGDHSPAGVEADWRDYGRLGRIVAFHDIARREAKYRLGVAPLFRRLASVRKSETISIDGQRRGIGVIWRS